MLGPLFRRTALPCSGGYHPERGWIPLHNAVGINCRKRATTKIKPQVLSVWAKGLRDCVCVRVCVSQPAAEVSGLTN